MIWLIQFDEMNKQFIEADYLEYEGGVAVFKNSNMKTMSIVKDFIVIAPIEEGSIPINSVIYKKTE